MMLDLGCTYWAFTWEPLLAWRREQESVNANHSVSWRHNWQARWTEVTATLFLSEVLPYSEEIYRANHMELAYIWPGKDNVEATQQRFVSYGAHNRLPLPATSSEERRRSPRFCAASEPPMSRLRGVFRVSKAVQTSRRRDANSMLNRAPPTATADGRDPPTRHHGRRGPG